MLDEAEKESQSFMNLAKACESQSAAVGASRCRSYHLAVEIHCLCHCQVIRLNREQSIDQLQ